MLVLDDPLSAVDTETERALVERLRPGAGGPHGAGRSAAAVDAGAGRPRGRAGRRPDRRAGHARRAARARAARSRPCSATRSLPRSAAPASRASGRTGGRSGAGLAAADLPRPCRRRSGRRLAGRARRRSTTASRAGDERPADVDVVVYLSSTLVGWVCGAYLIRGLAGIGQCDRARAAPRPLRPPHDAVAALLLRAAGRLDHRPPDERRGRRLATCCPRACRRWSRTSCLLPTTVIGCSSSTGGWAWSRWSCCRRRWSSRAGSSAARASRSARGAQPDRQRHRPARRVGRRAWRSCRRSTASARSRREFDGLNDANREGQRLRPEAVLGVLPRRSSCWAWSRPAPCCWSAPACSTTAR